MQARNEMNQQRPAPPSRPAIFFAVGLFSFLAILISYLAGRAAGLPPDDPQYFGVGVSIVLAFACAVIVVQNKRLRRTRRALAELAHEHAALVDRSLRLAKAEERMHALPAADALHDAPEATLAPDLHEPDLHDHDRTHRQST